ncbi:hypothetical protein PFISCL1PPCAC_22005, partial [Pristionchus fissidentatus]
LMQELYTLTRHLTFETIDCTLALRTPDQRDMFQTLAMLKFEKISLNDTYPGFSHLNPGYFDAMRAVLKSPTVTEITLDTVPLLRREIVHLYEQVVFFPHIKKFSVKMGGTSAKSMLAFIFGMQRGYFLSNDQNPTTTMERVQIFANPFLKVSLLNGNMLTTLTKQRPVYTLEMVKHNAPPPAPTDPIVPYRSRI